MLAIKASELTTDHVVMIAGFRYRITNIDQYPSGVVAVTIDTGYVEALSPDTRVAVLCHDCKT